MLCKYWSLCKRLHSNTGLPLLRAKGAMSVSLVAHFWNILSSLLLQHPDRITSNRGSQLLPLWPCFLQQYQFLLSSLQGKNMRSLQAVIIPFPQNLLFVDFLGKVTLWKEQQEVLKQLLQPLPVSIRNHRGLLSLLWQDHTALVDFFSTGKQQNTWASNLKTFQQFKLVLGTQVNDQHKTKLFFSSKPCQMYILSHKPAQGAKPYWLILQNQVR